MHLSTMKGLSFSFLPILLFVAFTTSPVIGYSHGIDFRRVLRIFEDCLVVLLNYKGLDVPSDTPSVTLRLPSLTKKKKSFYGEGDYRSRTRQHRSSMSSVVSPELGRVPFRCIAQFYVAPSAERTMDNIQAQEHGSSGDFGDPYDHRFSDFSKKRRKKRASAMYALNVPSPFDMMVSNPSLESIYKSQEGRYNILLQQSQSRSRYENLELWTDAYSEILIKQGVPSNGLILKIARVPGQGLFSSGLKVLGEMQIINQFRFLSNIVNSVEQISFPWGWDSRYLLDREIARVNDVSSNSDTVWMVKKQPSMAEIMQMYESFHQYESHSDPFVDQVLAGKVGMNRANDLYPRSIIEEGMENYIFARLALGNATIINRIPGVFDNMFAPTKMPQIMFDFEDKQYFSGPRQRKALITCSQKLWATYSPGLMGVIKQFLMIYEPRIYFAIGITYPLPAILFAILYFCTRIKKMHGKTPMSHAPFTLWFPNLLDQVVDRRWNKGRFGFMAYVVAAWLLMSVVLKYAFKGNNIAFLNQPSSIRYRRWLSYYSADLLDLQIYSDTGARNKRRGFSQAFGNTPRTPVPAAYESLADIVARNESIVLETLNDRAVAIDKILRRKFCQPTRGEVYRSGGYRGWLIANWMDKKIPARIQRLVESGISNQWRHMIRWLANNFDAYNDWRMRSFVQSVSLRSNIRYVFLFLLYSICGVSFIWLLEHLLYAIVNALTRTKSKKKMSTRGEMRRIVEGLNKLLMRKRHTNSPAATAKIMVCEKGLKLKLDEI